ncbi:MFS transporter [Helicobacter sp. T3_23-1059]
MKLYSISFSVYSIISIFTLMIYGALPAIMAKDGIAPQEIGLLYLTMIPFMLSFFYSGLVEIWRKKHAHNFKILCLALGLVSAVSFIALGAFASPQDIGLLCVAFMVMCLLGACAIISLNAIAIEQTSADKKVSLNTIMLLASGVGGIMGIIVALIIYEKYGFSVACFVMAFFVALLCVPFVRMSSNGQYGNLRGVNSEISPANSAKIATNATNYAIDSSPSKDSLHFKDSCHSKDSILQTLKSLSLWGWLGFFCLCMLPIALANTTSTMLLVYIGFSLDVVGIVGGVINCVAMFVGAPLAYLLIRIFGFRPAFITLLAFCACVFLLLLANMWLWQNHALILLGLACIGVYMCALCVFMYSLGMRVCESSAQSGVDFSFLRSAENACFVIGGVIASQILGIFIAQDTIEALSSGEGHSHHSRETYFDGADFGSADFGSAGLDSGDSSVASAESSLSGVSEALADFSEVLARNGIESSVANGYFALFCASLVFGLIALAITACNKKIT